MLKFIKHNMETITGIEIYPVIALLIFFIFFSALIVWVFTYRKEALNELSRLPLEQEEQQHQNTNILKP